MNKRQKLEAYAAQLRREAKEYEFELANELRAEANNLDGVSHSMSKQDNLGKLRTFIPQS